MSLPQSIVKKLIDAIASQRKNQFLWLPVFFAIGIGIYFSLETEPPIILGVMASVFWAVALLFLHSKQYKSRFKTTGWIIVVILFIISSGFLCVQIRTHNVQNTTLLKKIGPVEIIGTIKTMESLGAKGGSRITLSDLDIERLAPAQTPKLIRLRLHKDKNVQAGDRIKILGLLNAPSPPVAPRAFDFQRYLYFQQIGGVGFVYNDPEILEPKSSSSLLVKVDILRTKIAKKIKERLKEPNSSIAIALITGQRKMIDEGDLEALRGAGLAHLLAISGLHLGLVAGVLFFFSRLIMASIMKVSIRYPVKKYAAAIAFIGAFLYMWLVGAPVTTQRAMIMTGIVLGAIIVDRTAISLRLVALAALIILIIAPENLLSASFHMSFAAVGALIAIYEHLKPALSSLYRSARLPKKIALYFMGVCLTSLIASIATAPFALYHFQRFALFGLIGNLVAVPLMAFVVMPMAVLALLLMPLKLGFIPLYLMGYGIGGILDIAHWVYNLESSVAYISAWPLSALLSFVAGGLFLILGVGRAKIMALAFALLGGFFIVNLAPHDILISPSGKLQSFRSSQGDLYTSSKSSERFTLKNWERRSGIKEGSSIKWPREGSIENLSCGEQGCRLLINNVKVAFPKSPYAQQEDCQWADIFIANFPVKDWECKSPYIIDKFDTWRSGAHGVWIDKNGDITIKNADQSRGKRPWVITKTPSKKKNPTHTKVKNSSDMYASD